ncbi:MAG: hypothetical protein FD143_819 [Ignavibacteria bacterium]|nr:MAG: hypothetical protein FD143_819 [Ignavibacteria bacterium]KAF0160595.1 MAG: hypothetical protein FD188_1587 [Ignavibacteria bacterium]
MKLYIITTITLVLLHSWIGTPSHSYQFTAHRTEIIEDYLEEKEFSTCEGNICDYGKK